MAKKWLKLRYASLQVRSGEVIAMRQVYLWASILITVAFLSILVPLVSHDPNLLKPADRLISPNASHWFGTDGLGRDIFSRVFSAGRLSLLIGIGIGLLSLLLGSCVGIISGYFTKSSVVLMRMMDILFSVPVIVLAIALITVLDSGITSEIIVISLVLMPYVARVIRSRVLVLAQMDFLSAARLSGSTRLATLIKHVIPNAADAIITQGVLACAVAILADSSLSFLGLGVAPPAATWGNMIADGRDFLEIAPWIMVVPGAMIMITVLSLNMIGTSLRVARSR